MSDPAMEAVFTRLRRASAAVAEINRGAEISRQVGVYADAHDRGRRVQRRAFAALRRVYGANSDSEAEQWLNEDLAFLRVLLERSAATLAEDALQQMRRIRRNLWNRYLHHRQSPATSGRPGVSGEGLDPLARALAAWLVWNSPAPFPALVEDERYWDEDPLGVPGPPPTIPLPGGVPNAPAAASDPADAGVPEPQQPSPPPPIGQEGGLNLPLRWSRWGNHPNRDQRYASRLLQTHDQQELKRRLLAPEADGHPVLVLIGHFRTPADIYFMLREPRPIRNEQLWRLVREVEQYLARGERDFTRALQGRDWETLRPMLETAKWSLFPNAPMENRSARHPQQVVDARTSTDEGIHYFCDLIIRRVVGWSLRDRFFALTIAASVVLVVISMGAASPLVAVVAQGALGAFNLMAMGVDLALMHAENLERERINRYALIDQALAVAAGPENMTLAVALAVMTLLLPPAARAARQGIRASLARRALHGLPQEVVPATRSVRAPAPQAATDEVARGTQAPQRGTGSGPRAATRPVDGREARRRPTGERSRSPETTDDVGEAIDRMRLPDDTPWQPLPAGQLPTHVGMQLNREQQDIMYNFLGRTWNNLNPLIPSQALSAQRRAALRLADERARDMLLQIRRHWEAALPPRTASAADAARRVYQRMPENLTSSEANNWIRDRLFNPWRTRAMRRIFNDRQLRANLREAGITIHWRPNARRTGPRTIGSFRIRGRNLRGEIEHVTLDIDHALTRHEDAVLDAISRRSWQPLVSTVEATNMQLLTGRENRIVIEALRRQARELWDNATAILPAHLR